MKQYIISIIRICLPLIAIMMFTFCTTRENNTKETSESIINREANIEYAKLFTISYTKKGKIITLKNPWDTTKVFENYYVDKNVEGKYDILNRVVLTSSPQIGFLQILGLLDSVVAVSDKKQIYNLLLREGLQSGRIVDIGNAININAEHLILVNGDIIFKSAFPDVKSKDKKLIDLKLPIVYTAAWKEYSPLARMEWVKFYAAFFNKEEEADSIFNKTKEEYLRLQKEMINVRHRTTVMQGLPYGGVWDVPGGRSFKAQLFEDAGGDYFWQNDTSSGSLTLGIEEVVSKEMNADVWIDAVVESRKELLSLDYRFGEFKSIKNKEVYNVSGQTNEFGVNEYWETSIVYPQIMLKDLISIFHKEIDSTYTLYYYKKIE